MKQAKATLAECAKAIALYSTMAVLFGLGLWYFAGTQYMTEFYASDAWQRECDAEPPRSLAEIARAAVAFTGMILTAKPFIKDVFVDTRSIVEPAGALAVAAIPDQPEVHLRPNKLVTYRHVAMIMATAQRLGVTKIGIVGNEQFL